MSPAQAACSRAFAPTPQGPGALTRHGAHLQAWPELSVTSSPGAASGGEQLQPPSARLLCFSPTPVGGGRDRKRRRPRAQHCSRQALHHEPCRRRTVVAVPPGTGVQAAPGLLRRGRAQTWGAGAGREQVPGPVGLALALTQSPDGPHGPAQGVREEPRAAGQEGLRGQAGSRVPPEAQPPGDHGHTGTLGSRAEARQRSPRRTGGGRLPRTPGPSAPAPAPLCQVQAEPDSKQLKGLLEPA